MSSLHSWFIHGISEMAEVIGWLLPTTQQLINFINCRTFQNWTKQGIVDLEREDFKNNNTVVYREFEKFLFVRGEIVFTPAKQLNPKNFVEYPTTFRGIKTEGFLKIAGENVPIIMAMNLTLSGLVVHFKFYQNFDQKKLRQAWYTVVYM